MENLKTQLEIQYKKAFFSKIKEDLSKSPPDTQHITVIIQELVNGLQLLVIFSKNHCLVGVLLLFQLFTD